MSPRSAKKTGAGAKAKGRPEAPIDIPFEQALTELETIVEELETGSLELESSNDRFERGIKLSKHLQKQLREAESRVQKLVAQEQGEPVLEDFETEEENLEDNAKQKVDEEGDPQLPF